MQPCRCKCRCTWSQIPLQCQAGIFSVSIIWLHFMVIHHMRKALLSICACITPISTAICFAGREGMSRLPLDCRLCKSVSAPLFTSQPIKHNMRPTAAARWRLLRMHFLTFPAASRQLTLQRLRDTVAAAQEAQRHKSARMVAAEAFLFGGSAPGAKHKAAGVEEVPLWQAFANAMLTGP